MTPKNDKKFNFWGSLALVIFSIAFLIASFALRIFGTLSSETLALKAVPSHKAMCSAIFIG